MCIEVKLKSHLSCIEYVSNVHWICMECALTLCRFLILRASNWYWMCIEFAFALYGICIECALEWALNLHISYIEFALSYR